MKYAVIALQGKQYKVSEGDKLTIDLLEEKEVDKTFDVTDVLLLSDNGKVSVGTPTLKNKVTLKVLEHGKDAKLRVFKYKSKSKYRKTIGHRQRITNLEVISIA